MNTVYRLLAKNTSPGRIAGFVLSNFIGLAIIICSLVFYADAGSLWSSEDSFVKSDYIVVNKKVTSADMYDGGASVMMTPSEVKDLAAQPWVRRLGEFSSNDYKVYASMENGGRSLSTMLFFESVPDEFVDAGEGAWQFDSTRNSVPVILSRDYLTLYNFGFAGSAGLPRLSENIMGGIPLKLNLVSEDGTKSRELDAAVVGFSNRLNTILVPQSFMDWSNRELGHGTTAEHNVSRVILDVSSPGDVAISKYLDEHEMELAGDKSASAATFLLKVITGIIVTVGAVITILSFFILLLSISLLMEKNREKLHSLLMLGYPLRRVASPYMVIVCVASLLAYGLAVLCGLLLRHGYSEALKGLGATSGSPWVGLMVGGIVTLLIIVFNCYAVNRRVTASWALRR